MTWRVLPNGRCVPITHTEDLVSDARTLCEDLEQLMAETSAVNIEARRVVSASRRVRRLRETPLHLVRSREPNDAL